MCDECDKGNAEIDGEEKLRNDKTSYVSVSTTVTVAGIKLIEMEQERERSSHSLLQYDFVTDIIIPKRFATHRPTRAYLMIMMMIAIYLLK